MRHHRPARALIATTPLISLLAALLVGCADEPTAPDTAPRHGGPLLDAGTAALFIGGPSVRVTPNVQVEFTWSADFVGDGKVEVLDIDFGRFVASQQSLNPSQNHTLVVPIAGALAPDTWYYFRVTHTDPNDNSRSLTSVAADFFTGDQAIVSRSAVPDWGSARITWQANVVGLGRVQYGLLGTARADMQVLDDQSNSTAHIIDVTGLAPGTTYEFWLSNRHAIDGDVLAEARGQFTTSGVNATLPCGSFFSCQFTRGPSVRVTPNNTVEFKWSVDFGGDGVVYVFDNPLGFGNPIDGLASVPYATDHTLTATIGGILRPDTKYYFMVIHTDPNDIRPPRVNGPPPLPPFYTGAQAIGAVAVVPDVGGATISWNGNVIGLGRVEYGASRATALVLDDQNNVTGHSFQLTGLSPGTTYQYWVSNRHAIDGDVLAEATGSFTTLGVNIPPGAVEQINDLKDAVTALGLKAGLGVSLQAKLNAALAALDVGDIGQACVALQAFIREVNAQIGKKISSAEARQLVKDATRIATLLDC